MRWKLSGLSAAKGHLSINSVGTARLAEACAGVNRLSVLSANAGPLVSGKRSL